ncbi:hypothetical protein BJF84_21250 [Rhodococcus sp. CUA-806]|jgi:hypothetical protein|nr:hypothetical protein BJF84_21250 [Rhodococcus sp. CUA-806]
MTTLTDSFVNGLLAGVQGKVLFQSVGAHTSADGTKTVLGVKFVVLVPATGVFTVSLDPGTYRVWREFIGFTDGPHLIVVPASGSPKLRDLIALGAG